MWTPLNLCLAVPAIPPASDRESHRVSRSARATTRPNDGPTDLQSPAVHPEDWWSETGLLPYRTILPVQIDHTQNRHMFAPSNAAWSAPPVATYTIRDPTPDNRVQTTIPLSNAPPGSFRHNVRALLHLLIPPGRQPNLRYTRVHRKSRLRAQHPAITAPYSAILVACGSEPSTGWGFRRSTPNC